MTSVLWIAPNFNHYKVCFLKKLAQRGLDIHVIAGTASPNLGHVPTSHDVEELPVTRVEVEAAKFQNVWRIYTTLWHLIGTKKPQVVLIPCEKKYLAVIVYLALLRRTRRQYAFVTYTHPIMRSRGSRWKGVNKWITRAMFGTFDRVIFYTQNAMREALQLRLLGRNKAAFANNTLDTEAIDKVYSYTPPPATPRLLFIGRLVPSKRIDLLLEYYKKLRHKFSDISLNIIGDGPEAHLVQAAMQVSPEIIWSGPLSVEAEIADHMRQAQLVFLPGRSGLAVVHAFCYGRPFATLSADDHGPEAAYLRDDWNGLYLSGDIDNDVSRLYQLLSSRDRLMQLSQNAYQTSKQLAIGHWCDQMETALEI